MNDVFLDLSPRIRERLALALETGILSLITMESGLRAILGGSLPYAAIQKGLAEMKGLGLPEQAAASWIRSVDKIIAKTRKPDLVWSGPAVPNLHARNTRQVYEEILSSANHTLWASTYAFFDGPKAFETIARRMEEMPTLVVKLLLNIQRKKGEDAAADYLVRKFADRFWKWDWPGKRKPLVWYDPRALDPDGPSGVLHAKAVVCDEEVVYVTSANLTEAALDRNIELGLLLRDSAIAASVAAHYQALIDQGWLSRLPQG